MLARLSLGSTIALGFALLAMPAIAQNRPATIVRTPLAAAHLASVVEMPLFLRLYRVSLPAARRSSYSGANAMLYSQSGIPTVDIAGTARPLAEGAGAFIPAGQTATISASASAPAHLLVFILTARPNQRKPLLDRPASVQEVARTPEPLPGLKPGPYEFSLTRVTLPPGMPANRAHYRSGAAMYYVVAGAGMLTADGKTEPRSTGTAQVEPAGWVHQWANPGNDPLVLLQANISPEGVPAVIAATATATAAGN